MARLTVKPRLDTATDADRETLRGWFSTAREVRHWGGPAFRFPFTPATFIEDLRWHEVANRALRDADGNFLGFGQFYARDGRIHLARLAVDPARRGNGLGTTLVHALMSEGRRHHDLPAYSLFVCNDNVAALALYRKLGFRDSDSSQPSDRFEGNTLMTRTAA